MSTGTDAENASGAGTPGTPGAPSGLPRRNRAAPPPPSPRREKTPEASHDTDDLAGIEDTLSPEALARAMTAIHLGSMRARLSKPDEPDESDTRPAPTAASAKGTRSAPPPTATAAGGTDQRAAPGPDQPRCAARVSADRPPPRPPRTRRDPLTPTDCEEQSGND
ncbi:hypothetical protein ACWD4G_14750 [Streptomyces sp. NPDC002643]